MLGIDWSRISVYLASRGLFSRSSVHQLILNSVKSSWAALARHLCTVIILPSFPRLSCLISLNFIAQTEGSQGI